MKTCYSKLVNTQTPFKFNFFLKDYSHLMLININFSFCNQQLVSLEHTVASSNPY